MATNTEAQIPEGIKYTENYYTWEHEERVYDFPDHQTATFEQSVEQISGTESVVRVRIAEEFPGFRSGLPIAGLPEGMEAYLAHDDFIQRDAPEIAEARAIIEAEGPYNDLHHLVWNVLSWTRYHLSYGNPNEIHDAVRAYNERVVNCIGYVHLPAAILRSMGIPARTVRTFYYSSTFTRHYLLEVYYPEDDTWVTFEPQLAWTPMIGNIAVYIDATWNQEKHVESRRFSLDPRMRALRGLPSSLPSTVESGQWPRGIDDAHYNFPKVQGLNLAGNKNFFATIAYPPAIPGPSFSRSDFTDRSSLVIYGMNESESYFSQQIELNDYLSDAIDSDGGKQTANKLITTFSMGMEYPMRTQTGPSISMGEEWIAVGMYLKGKEANEDSIVRELRPGLQTSADHQHYGLLMMFRLENDGRWHHKQNLTQPFAREWNRFGSEVVFHEDFMLVSAPNTMTAESPGGEIQIYRLYDDEWVFAGTWSEEEPDTRIRSYGGRMHSDGQRLAVSSEKGIYIYRLGGEEFLQREAFIEIKVEGIAPSFDPHDIHISGSRLLIGLAYADIRGENSGAALIYEEDNGIWNRSELLLPADLVSNDQFGSSVLEVDGMIFVSAHNKTTSFSSFSGGVYVFDRLQSDAWTPVTFLQADNKIDNPGLQADRQSRGFENMGFEIIHFGGEILASAPGPHSGRQLPIMGGSFYRFDPPESSRQLRKTADSGTEFTAITTVQPNPVISFAEVNFTLPEAGETDLIVSKREGGQVLSLFSDRLEPGTYQIGADLIDLPPGEYRLQLETPSGSDFFDFIRVSRNELSEIE